MGVGVPATTTGTVAFFARLTGMLQRSAVPSAPTTRPSLSTTTAGHAPVTAERQRTAPEAVRSSRSPGVVSVRVESAPAAPCFHRAPPAAVRIARVPPASMPNV